MKRKTSKEILADSFRELSEKMPIDKITVREIAENCGYSAATFYRQFKDKYDLIAWDYARDFEKILEPLSRSRAMWRRTVIDGAVYYNDHRAYIANLLLHTSGYDSFLLYMSEMHIEKMSRLIRKCANVRTLDKQTEMYIRLYCLGTVCFTCEWILGKHELTPGEVAKIYENSVPEPLRKYLAEEE